MTASYTYFAYFLKCILCIDLQYRLYQILCSEKQQAAAEVITVKYGLLKYFLILFRIFIGLVTFLQ